MLMVHAGGSSFSNGQGEPLDAPSCSMSCAGAASETCGGSWALSLYTTGASTGIVSALPSNSTSIPAGWTASGCRQDLVDHERTLTVDAFTSDAMTLAMCDEHCAVRGHTIAGVEHARECYCGSAFANGGGAVLPDGACDMACSGDATTLCGGPGALSAFQIASGSEEAGAGARRAYRPRGVYRA